MISRSLVSISIKTICCQVPSIKLLSLNGIVKLGPRICSHIVRIKENTGLIAVTAGGKLARPGQFSM